MGRPPCKCMVCIRCKRREKQRRRMERQGEEDLAFVGEFPRVRLTLSYDDVYGQTGAAMFVECGGLDSSNTGRKRSAKAPMRRLVSGE